MRLGDWRLGVDGAPWRGKVPCNAATVHGRARGDCTVLLLMPLAAIIMPGGANQSKRGGPRISKNRANKTAFIAVVRYEGNSQTFLDARIALWVR
jgi:hypothetical protein